MNLKQVKKIPWTRDLKSDKSEFLVVGEDKTLLLKCNNKEELIKEIDNVISKIDYRDIATEKAEIKYLTKKEEAFLKNLENQQDNNNGGDIKEIDEEEDEKLKNMEEELINNEKKKEENGDVTEERKKGRILYDFNTDVENELKCKENEIISIIEICDDGWTEAELNGKYIKTNINIILNIKY
jgi:hypothetical protein